MHKMEVITEKAINKHFDDRAESIKVDSMSDARDRLLNANEDERKKYIQEFQKVGKIKVNVVGQQWNLIADSDM